eukprot:TRINITY_DN1351_c0_g2_i1.p1 TRINITY_DN1351_c0_g2~~TRINITY_DN1351_c0_g2_i1.p1  ORF type:complete len:491 (+),score=121.74 TRINITY_DN1351_c0_g2_i1:85-1473(+)
MRGCVAVLGAAACAAAADLTAETFDDEVFREGRGAFVKFYAPWCGHCKRMAPAWQDLAELYSGSDKVIVGSVDCTTQSAVCDRFGVQGFPTLKWWAPGERSPREYSGGRHADALQSHVAKTMLGGAEPPRKAKAKKVAGANVQVRKVSAARLQPGMTGGEGIMAFITGDADSFPALEIAARRPEPRLVFLDQFGEFFGQLPLEESTSPADLRKILADQGITPETPRPKVKDTDAGISCVAWRQVTASGARHPVGDVSCRARIHPGGGVGYCECDEGRRVKVWLHDKRQTFTCNSICRSGLHWLEQGDRQGGPDLDVPPGRLIHAAIAAEGASAAAEEKPQAAAEGAAGGGGQVVELGPDTFKAETGSARDTLVFFHATWCGHCKKLMPAYRELAKFYAGRQADLLVASYDAPANPDVAKAQGVRSFPWIVYYPKQGGTPVKFEGDRSLEGLKHFVDERLGIM